MKAVSYEGKRRMVVSDHPKPKLQQPTDAILRVTTSGICGSDLHMYDGRTPLWIKGRWWVTRLWGQCPVKKYNEYLRDLVLQGKAHPGKIVSHHIKIQDAPDAYDKFDKRVEGYNKILIRFEDAMAA